MNNSNIKKQHVTLLNEILLAPSNQTLSHRFSAKSQAAGCNGQCKSGSCITLALPADFA